MIMATKEKRKGLLSGGLFDKPFMDSKANTNSVSTKEWVLGHLIGPLGLIFVVNTIAALVEKFFTQQTGAMYGASNVDMIRQMGGWYEIIMTTAKVLAVGIGLLNGWLIQKTESRQGRMRPWHLIFGFISIAIGGLIFLFPGNTLGEGYWIYFFFLLICYHTVGSSYFYLFRDNICSLTTRDPKEKTHIQFIRKMSWTLLSGIVIGMVFNMVVLPMWLEKDINGYPILMVTMSIIAIPLLLLEYFYTRERISEDVAVEHGRLDEKQHSLREQMKAIREELGEDNIQSELDGFLEETRKLKAPKEVKEKLEKEINRLKLLGMNSSESGVIRGYVETLLEMPWSKMQKETADIKLAQEILDEDHYGLEQVKERVLEFLAVRTLNKHGQSPILCLVGPPGTGKTLLAKAVAGEANVPFLSISGSDFVEMFVGVGASRVRDLFEQAKKVAPCIVFIDEIDAIGRARGKNSGFSGNDERENTLNQLLTEMDGFQTNTGVIVLAATNRVDILDKALMRAGRFDRQIEVGLPDVKERKEIFDVHLKRLKLGKKLDREFLAKQTPGFAGADIANVCNEAALIAARNDKDCVTQEDFLAAIDRIVGGLERRNMPMTAKERRATAIHEAGHATVMWRLKNCDPVLKITIIPRGRSLGATWYLPEERVNHNVEHFMHKLAGLLGGRIAEQLLLDITSTGAINDLERTTKTAYAMVAYYGMSPKVGNISFYDATGQRDMFTKPFSEQTAVTIDEEVRRIVEEAVELTRRIITEERENIERLADLLLDKETIFAEDVEAILGKSAQQIEKELNSTEEESANQEHKAEEVESEVLSTNEGDITYIVEPAKPENESDKTE